MRVFHLARKPLTGSVASNTLEHGTGAINVDGCRIGDFINTTTSGVDRRNKKLAELGYRPGEYQKGEATLSLKEGRWPANVLMLHREEIRQQFPLTMSGARKAGGYGVAGSAHVYGAWGTKSMPSLTGDSGSATRFFFSYGEDRSCTDL